MMITLEKRIAEVGKDGTRGVGRREIERGEWNEVRETQKTWKNDRKGEGR